MNIFPAIDLKRDAVGRCRCVRLLQGRADAETEFSADPPAVARRWRDAGARWLHIVDLDGAFQGHPANTEAIAGIVAATGARTQAGGGIRDTAAADRLLCEVGVTRIVVGTRALADREWLAGLCRRYPGRIVGSIDARDGRVSTHGWTQDAEVDAIDAALTFAGCGVAAIVFTDIAADGMLSGPNIAATEQLARAVRVPVIASGGVATLDDVRRLATLPLEGIIIGKALYTGAIDLRDAVAMALKPPA